VILLRARYKYNHDKCQKLIEGEGIDKYIKAHKVNWWELPNGM